MLNREGDGDWGSITPLVVVLPALFQLCRDNEIMHDNDMADMPVKQDRNSAQRAWKPLLRVPYIVGQDRVTFGGRADLISKKSNVAEMADILKRLDGKTSFDDVIGAPKKGGAGFAEELLEALDHADLIDEADSPACRSGSEVILEIEEAVEKLCDETIYRNIFWETCLNAKKPGDLSQELATGMVIENWHFLFRESYFDAPVLSYVANTEVRLLLNEFFAEEYGHDEILIKSLESVGLTRADMADAIPLPQTMGLCNALAYWAHNDPLFFFATLGLLEGQGMKEDSFIEACTRVGLPDAFVEPLRIHANININAGHGNLTRMIFQKIDAISENDVARLKAQIPLFVHLYNEFYVSIWRHYEQQGGGLRRVSEL